jgi:prolyl-tRNA synthetase
MRMSQLLLQTLREPPGEARTHGHQLLLRSGFIKPAAGGFAFLPLESQRQQIEEAVCRLLGSCGGQPISLPVVRPAEIGSGVPGERSVRFRDRAQREMILSAAHDDAVLASSIGVIRSYRQLPILLYQAWQRFRDDDHPIGGLLGAREGRVVDAYGLYRELDELAAEYGKVRQALSELLAPWDLGLREVVFAEDGAGRPLAHAAVYPVADGELTGPSRPACGHTEPPSPTGASHCAGRAAAHADVETPDRKTIWLRVS